MRPWQGWGLLAAMLAASLAALWVPGWAAAGMTAAAWAAMRRRAGFTLFVAITVAINALLLAWLLDGPGPSLGPVDLSWHGLEQGAFAGARLAALLGVNLAVLQHVAPARLLEGMRLPRRPTGFLASVLITAHDIGRDFARIRAARQVEGSWPKGRIRQAGAAATLLPPLFVAAHDRARRRREALQVAGIHTGPDFAPIVAMTGLAVAGRLALVALPNVSLTYVVVFLGGVAFGIRVGFWSAVWSMVLTDLALSGLFLPSFVNVPAMALVGVLGGLVGRLDWHSDGAVDRWGARMLAAAIGVFATIVFSVASDALSWALIAENRQSLARLKVGILAGLAFNIVPAITNGVLFATAVTPVAQAFAALQEGRLPAPPTGQAGATARPGPSLSSRRGP